MIAEFTVVPLDKGAHLSKWVAPILGIVSESGISYQFTAMGTILEGDWDEVMGVVRRCHERMREISERVVTTVKIDDHAGRTGYAAARILTGCRGGEQQVGGHFGDVDRDTADRTRQSR